MEGFGDDFVEAVEFCGGGRVLEAIDQLYCQQEKELSCYICGGPESGCVSRASLGRFA